MRPWVTLVGVIALSTLCACGGGSARSDGAPDGNELAAMRLGRLDVPGFKCGGDEDGMICACFDDRNDQWTCDGMAELCDKMSTKRVCVGGICMCQAVLVSRASDPTDPPSASSHGNVALDAALLAAPPTSIESGVLEASRGLGVPVANYTCVGDATSVQCSCKKNSDCGGMKDFCDLVIRKDMVCGGDGRCVCGSPPSSPP